ncbi:hypothetical protein HUT06_37470 [Actinomadura sp. NAK00032]|uniref:hypothetical protein n=1 Tax=Actinomadura sp. NAK00032 TaxID=2742128 RepID=UPI00159032FE|nr:hypothetical protein [Actinomadura sp. NAK00032]QKW39017.1 hypothetical protein HUT06_37470 [Actinomadura sp. NAK00032]
MSGTEALAIALGIALSLPIPSSVFLYLHTRRSEREQQKDREAAHDALANALPYYRRAELHYIRQHIEHPGTQSARDAHSASFRARSTAHLSLLRVRIANTDPHTVTLAQRAFDLTGQIHYAETLEQATQDAAGSIQALRDFITATGATVHSTTPLTELWPPDPEEPLPRTSAAREADNGQDELHPRPDTETKP